MTDTVYGGDNAFRRVSQFAKSTAQILTTDLVRVGCKLLKLFQSFLHIVRCSISYVVVAGTRLWYMLPVRTDVEVQKVEIEQDGRTKPLRVFGGGGGADPVLGAEPHSSQTIEMCLPEARLSRRSFRDMQLSCGTAQRLQADENVG